MKTIILLLVTTILNAASALAGGSFGSDAYLVTVSGLLLHQEPGLAAGKTAITNKNLLKLKGITSDFGKYALAIIESPGGYDLVIVDKTTKEVTDIIATFENSTVIDEGSKLSIHGHCFGDVETPTHIEMQGASLLRLKDTADGTLKGSGAFDISTGVITPAAAGQGTILKATFSTNNQKITGITVP